MNKGPVQCPHCVLKDEDDNGYGICGLREWGGHHVGPDVCAKCVADGGFWKHREAEAARHEKWKRENMTTKEVTHE